MRNRLLGAALSLLAACSLEPQAGQSLKETKSSSPEVIQLIDMQLATGQHLYILEYRTKLPITDTGNLAKEAETLWPDLQLKAEAAGHSTAGIRAVMQPVNSFITRTDTYTFIWERDQSGKWHRLQPGG